MQSEFARERSERKDSFEDFGPISGLVRGLVRYVEHSTVGDAINAIGTRLEQLQKGAPYQKGDRFKVFDRKKGYMDTLNVQNIVPDELEGGNKLEVKRESQGGECGVFQISEKEADLFCRGSRMSLLSALLDVYWELSATTVNWPKKIAQFILEVHQKIKSPGINDICEEAKTRGIDLPDNFFVERDLANAIIHFYYDTPPDYNGLLHALSALAEYQKQAVGSVRQGKRVGRIFPRAGDSTDHFLLCELQPVHNTPLFGVLLERYEGRVNTTEKAMLNVLNVMQEETGTVPFVMEWRNGAPETL
jgi:hypothetical protein